MITNEILKALGLSLGICYFLHCKNGWYPDIYRNCLKLKPTKFSKHKFGLFKTFGGETGVELVKDNDTSLS